MAQYIVLHRYVKSPQEFAAFFTPARVAGMAQSMASGQTPAHCIKTWDASAHGRTDYFVCLWEGPSSQAVEETLRGSGILDYISADIMQVDEMDWAQLAKMAA
jgi:hypothetical protein